MVCTSLLTKDENLPYAEGNQEKELRFHRILRENKDSEPVGFQQIDLEDSDTFQMSKRQRATQGTWNPIGKRTKVSQIQSSLCCVSSKSLGFGLVQIIGSCDTLHCM